MSRQEIKAYQALISSLLAFSIYCIWMFVLYRAGRFAGEGSSELMGRSVFVLIVLGIVSDLVVRLALKFAGLRADPEDDALPDERDRMIEMKGMQIFLGLFVLGVFAAMGALALGVAPVGVLFLVIVAMFIGSIADDIAKIAFYRRGLAV